MEKFKNLGKPESILKSSLVEVGLNSEIIEDSTAIAWLDTQKAAIRTTTAIFLNDKIFNLEGDILEIENNSSGREKLNNIPEPYKTAILAVWGTETEIKKLN